MDRILQEAERKRCEAWNNMQRAAGDLGRSVQMAVSHVQLQTKGIEQHFKNAEATVKAVVMGFHSQWVQIQHQQAMFGSVPFAVSLRYSAATCSPLFIRNKHMQFPPFLALLSL